jgi:hypothetical protein
VYQGEVLFLREKLEAQGRELEAERAAQRHLAADLNRELHNLNKQKEAEVQAVRYRSLADQCWVRILDVCPGS